MTAASATTMSDEASLELERKSADKHEWCDGVVYAMSRGTPEYARVAMRIGSARSFSSDAMIWFERAKLSTYADASVVCGTLETKNVKKGGRSLGAAITPRRSSSRCSRRRPSGTTATRSSRRNQRLDSLREYVLASHERGAHCVCHAARWWVPSGA